MIQQNDAVKLEDGILSPAHRFGVMASYGKSSGNFKSDAYSLTTLFRF